MQLPTELLLAILQHLGPEFFQDEHERLTVCKRWHTVARLVFYESLQLSVNELPALLRSEGIDDRLKTIKHSLRVLSIELRTPYKMKHRFPHVVSAHPEFEGWSVAMNADMAAVASLLQGSSKFQELHLTRHTEERCLSLKSVGSLLSAAKRLAVLELDTSVSLPDDTHICPLIGSLLRSLRSLRLRMRYICPDVLRLVDDACSIPLKTLVVNLAAHNMITCDSFNVRRCDTGFGSSSELVGEFLEHARSLATRMVDAEEITVVFRNRGVQLKSVDLLTSKRRHINVFGSWEYADQAGY